MAVDIAAWLFAATVIIMVAVPDPAWTAVYLVLLIVATALSGYRFRRGLRRLRSGQPRP